MVRFVRAARFAALAASAALLAGCHVVTDTELAQIRSQGQHHGPDPARVFSDQIVPYADRNAKPAAQVIEAMKRDFDGACRQYGFRQSSAFPCNFWLRVQGKVSRIDTASRVGKAYVQLDRAAADAPLQVVLETGPVLIGTGVRDGFPGVKYSDFDDQTRFAVFGQQINRLVVERVQRSLRLKTGEAVDVAAVYSGWSEPAGDVRAVPVAWK